MERVAKTSSCSSFEMGDFHLTSACKSKCALCAYATNCLTFAIYSSSLNASELLMGSCLLWKAASSWSWSQACIPGFYMKTKADLKRNLGGYVFTRKLNCPGTILVHIAELTLSIDNWMDMCKLPLKNYSCLSYTLYQAWALTGRRWFGPGQNHARDCAENLTGMFEMWVLVSCVLPYSLHCYRYSQSISFSVSYRIT